MGDQEEVPVEAQVEISEAQAHQEVLEVDHHLHRVVEPFVVLPDELVLGVSTISHLL